MAATAGPSSAAFLSALAERAKLRVRLLGTRPGAADSSSTHCAAVLAPKLTAGDYAQAPSFRDNRRLNKKNIIGVDSYMLLCLGTEY